MSYVFLERHNFFLYNILRLHIQDVVDSMQILNNFESG